MNKLLLLFIVLLIIMILQNFIKEEFSMYQTYPNTLYQKYYTGSQPLNFYNYPIYRKPYRSGFVINQSYPTPHLNSLGFQLNN
jgi:hypothetical protein